MHVDLSSLRLEKDTLINLLTSKDQESFNYLYTKVDGLRKEFVGDQVHLRGLIELTNHCRCRCAYCGIASDNTAVTRYRMTKEEVMASAKRAMESGCKTVVLQGGEDPGIKKEWLADMIKQLKKEFGCAVTLSLGERSKDELVAWKKAGADRFLIRFETSDPVLFRRLHPHHSETQLEDRITLLKSLRKMGFEIGSGVMIGLPGQTYESIADDILLFQKLDLDMVGVGPYIPHPETPMGRSYKEQPPIFVQDSVETAYRVIALIRLVCPDLNIPSTTSIETSEEGGYLKGLQRGANVIMPNFTPLQYRKLYEIYPDKTCVNQGEVSKKSLTKWLASIGRTISDSKGFRNKCSNDHRESCRKRAKC